MQCYWKVGDAVECVKEPGKFIPNRNEKVPVVGQKYIIRSIFIYKDLVAIRLVEIVNTPNQYNTGVMECGFNVEIFRKLQAKKTDISIFKSMLKKSPEQNRKEIEESKVRDAIQEFAH